jgi:hypothetical protein
MRIAVPPSLNDNYALRVEAQFETLSSDDLSKETIDYEYKFNGKRGIRTSGRRRSP